MLMTLVSYFSLSHLLLIHFCDGAVFSAENEMDVISEGKQLYEDFNHKVQTYGDCWQKAVFELHAGCKTLTEETQARLALSFANCFLEKSGSETCDCSLDKPISDCLKNVNDRIFSTYREFFTHTKSICYFLQQRSWQKQTENTIVRLSASSEKVSQQLEESAKSQNEMLSLQQTVLKKHQDLINTTDFGIRNLNLELERSHKNARSIFEDFKTTTDEQRFLMFSVFEQVQKLEALVLGKFANFYTIIYYVLAVSLSYFLTSTPRTFDARIWLILLFTGNAAIEKIISSYSIVEESKSQILLQNDGPILDRIWACRNVCCILAIVILLLFFFHYKDYNIINNQLLVEIRKQNTEMQSYIKNLSQNMPITRNTFSDIPNGRSTAITPDLRETITLPTVPQSKELEEEERSGQSYLHSTPNPMKKITVASLGKPKKKKEALPFSPITVTSSKSVDEKNNSGSVQDDTPVRRYNLRDRSTLSSSRTTSYISMNAEASEKRKEQITRKLKRNRN